MKCARMRIVRLVFLILGLLCLAVLSTASPGFGRLRRKNLELKTRQPAPVRLANTSIAFKGAYTNQEYAPVLNSLLTTLGTELISNEKSLMLKEKPTDAAWVLGMSVTGFSVSPPQRRTDGSGNATMTYIRWNGSLNVAYQVLDNLGRVYDAGNVSSDYNKEFSSSALGRTSKSSWGIPMIGRRSSQSEKVPSTEEDVKQELIRDVVVQIASKLGNTTRSIDVQVATGDSHLDRAAEFFDQQLWSRGLDELEKAPAFPKPEDESYRQYDLGLAYEAISYNSSNANDQRENIFKAAEYYDKALELNPKEKYFVATVARTRDALARYKDLEQMAREDKKQKAEAPSRAVMVEHASTRTPKSDAKTSAPQRPTKALTLSDVIDMYNSKVSEDQIVGVIQSSSVEFNPYDKDTVITIAKAKLPVSLQNALRSKVGAPLLKAGSARAASSGKSQ